MGGGDLEAVEVVDEPMGFEDDEEIAGALGVMAVENKSGRLSGGHPAFQKGGAGNGVTDALEF